MWTDLPQLPDRDPGHEPRRHGLVRHDVVPPRAEEQQLQRLRFCPRLGLHHSVTTGQAPQPFVSSYDCCAENRYPLSVKMWWPPGQKNSRSSAVASALACDHTGGIIT
jgi:hypothetical protein